MAEPENIKTLIPISVDKLSSFKNRNNVDTTIYAVKATREDGGMVEEELRAFEELQTGVAQDFRIERYEHEQYGVSYTLYPVKKENKSSSGARLGPKVDALREEVEQLRTEVTALTTRLEALERQSGPPSDFTTEPPAPTPPPQDDDDIPF